MGIVISCHIPKGGNFKTTTVQACGEILSKDYGKRILCIDTDSQASLSLVSGIDTEAQKDNLYTLLNHECSIKDCIVSTKYYDLIPGALKLSTADSVLHEIGKENFLKEHIDQIRDDYDYIFIDTPPSLNLMNVMSATAADEMLITCEASYMSMSAIDQLYKTVQSVKKYLNPNLHMLGILIVRYNPRANINKSIVEAISKQAAAMKIHVFDVGIRETVKIREAQAQTIPLTEWANDCTAMCDYQDFIREVLKFI